MNRYKFASVRGADFEAQGETPCDAFENLLQQEKDNGSLWRLHDPLRIKTAIAKEGFSMLKCNGYSAAYKEIK